MAVRVMVRLALALSVAGLSAAEEWRNATGSMTAKEGNATATATRSEVPAWTDTHTTTSDAVEPNNTVPWWITPAFGMILILMLACACHIAHTRRHASFNELLMSIGSDEAPLPGEDTSFVIDVVLTPYAVVSDCDDRSFVRALPSVRSTTDGERSVVPPSASVRSNADERGAMPAFASVRSTADDRSVAPAFPSARSSDERGAVPAFPSVRSTTDGVVPPFASMRSNADERGAMPAFASVRSTRSTRSTSATLL